MLDLHCHFLPGIDDGPDTIGDALDLARAAVRDGVTEAVLTPHLHPGRYDNTRSSLREAFDGFRSILAREGIPLDVRLGGEMRLSPESLDLLARGEVPAIGTWQAAGRSFDVVLTEFPHDQVPEGAPDSVRWMRERGVLPMIAHPERNRGVLRDPFVLEPLVEAGCLLQLTAASVAGAFGPACEQMAHWLIQAGWATVVASDAHNLTHRPPAMSLARRALSATYGEPLAHRLTHDAPLAILTGAPSRILAGAPA